VKYLCLRAITMVALLLAIYSYPGWAQEEKANLAMRRLNDAAARFAELQSRFAESIGLAEWPEQFSGKSDSPERFKLIAPVVPKGKLSGRGSGFVDRQRREVGRYVTGEMDRLARLLNRKLQISWQWPYRVEEVNDVERALGPLELYINSWVAFDEYASRFAEDPYVVYTLDPTYSYRILPGGPRGHAEELSYYKWGFPDVGLINPQILPYTSPVPAVPSRRLEAFGCRGQYIPLSFAVQAGEAMPNLRFAVSDLQEDGKIIPAEAIDLRLVEAWWHPFGSDADTAVYTNELLVHDDEFVIAKPDRPVNHFKNARYAKDLPELAPFGIASGQTRQLWITVHIPPDARAGRYRGRIVAVDDAEHQFNLHLTIEVLPFELEPTPFAYSIYHQAALDLGTEFPPAGGHSILTGPQQPGLHGNYRTPAQMQAEYINMAQHGLNTLDTADGMMAKTEQGWDFSRLKLLLDMGMEAGLTRSPFIYRGHPIYFQPYEREDAPHTMEQVYDRIEEVVTKVNEFTDANGYPRAAFYGWDEASPAQMKYLKPLYQAVNDAGGIVAQATFKPAYFSSIGAALSLPIVLGGVTGGTEGYEDSYEASVRASQAAGHEVWVYGAPMTDRPASPAVYRRRYGLALWKNGEDGAMPFAYANPQGTEHFRPYMEKPRGKIYAMTYPTWEGPPIDTIIWEAFREGIYDTRYLATLLKYRDMAEKEGKAQALVKRVNQWLESFSVNDDLQQVRWQMVQWIQRLRAALAD